MNNKENESILTETLSNDKNKIKLIKTLIEHNGDIIYMKHENFIVINNDNINITKLLFDCEIEKNYQDENNNININLDCKIEIEINNTDKEQYNKIELLELLLDCNVEVIIQNENNITKIVLNCKIKVNIENELQLENEQIINKTIANCVFCSIF